jgi:ADP-ribosylglycohydrolase
MTKEKYIATLVEGALGETLGMSVEGWKEAQIKKHVGRVTKPLAPVIVRDANGVELSEDEFGKLKYWTRDLSEGDITDDGILTIAIAESLVAKRGMDLDDIMKRQFEAYDACIQPDGHIFGGFGKSTIDAFENYRKGIPPLDCGAFPGTGTGPCMKIAPIGLYMYSTGKKEDGKEMARQIGLATHLDERAIACGIVQANAIYQLLCGVNREEFINSAVSCCKENEKVNVPGFPKAEKGNLLSRLIWMRDNKDVSSGEAKKVLGCSSLAIEAYPFTLFMFQKYWDNPLEGVIETINYGGDCDTTGAMYGALSGAKNGIVFPANWKLNERARLTDLGEKLYALGE